MEIETHHTIGQQLHIEKDGIDTKVIAEQSKRGTEIEHTLSIWQALKLYPHAIGWSIFFALGLIMSGYDPSLLFSFFALPSFLQAYGVLQDDGTYTISAAWQSGLTMNVPVGQVVGSMLVTYPMERFGRKKTMAFCCVWSAACVFIQFFSTSIGMLCAGEFLAGVMYGAYLVMAPTIASEYCNIKIRGILEAYMNLAYVIGQFLVSGVTYAVVDRPDASAYRIPFAIQWIWPGIILIGLPFAPESPWWLVRKGRIDDAKKSLQKLTLASEKLDADATIAMMEQTNLLELEMMHNTTYLDCFRGVNLRRTEICVLVNIFQVICGQYMIGYATYFLTVAGLDPDLSFGLGLGVTAIGFVATCFSWFLITWFGRRNLWMWGLALGNICLFIVGFLDIPSNYDSNPSLAWAQGSWLLLYTATYQGSVGPLCFLVITEIGSTRLRSKTVALCTIVSSIVSIALTVGVPYMLNPPVGESWRGKMGFFFGGLGIIALVWSWYRFTEVKGYTFEEIDILFERQVPTRQFKKYNFNEEIVG